jgi:hypothetical protein
MLFCSFRKFCQNVWYWSWHWSWRGNSESIQACIIVFVMNVYRSYFMGQSRISNTGYYSQTVLRIRIRDPMPFWPKDQCLFIKTLDPVSLQMLDVDTNSVNPDPQHCFSQKSLFFPGYLWEKFQFFYFIKCRHNIKMQGGSSLWGVAQDSCRCPRRPRCKFLIWKWGWRWDWISWPSHGGWHLCLQTVPVMHLPKKWSGSMTFWCGSGPVDPCLWLMDPIVVKHENSRIRIHNRIH